jgi:hypothetical protein
VGQRVTRVVELINQVRGERKSLLEITPLYTLALYDTRVVELINQVSDTGAKLVLSYC